MTRAGFFVRFHARVHRDEGGFSLIETMFAITIMFGSLLALAYTATIGFGYEDLARQKDSAVGIADQIMEEARGLAYSKIQTGLLATENFSSDLTTSSPAGILVTGCSGDAAGVYRLFSCTAGTNGSGEKLVTSSGATNPTVPLVPHTNTVVVNNITYTWKTYVTNKCPVVDTSAGCGAVGAFRVTVLVTWSGGKASINKVVQTQSLFFSPGGCRSTATHPYAAPCQPFFFGQTTVPQGDVNIAGTISGPTFTSGDLLTTGVQSSVQQEQLSQAQGSFTAPGVRVVDTSGTRTTGSTAATTSAADTDPGTGTSPYQRKRCPPVLPSDPTCDPNPPSVSSSSGNSIVFSAPMGTTADTISTTSATSANVCPPPSGGEVDSLPCGGSRVQQGGTLTAQMTLNSLTPPLGTAVLAQVAAAESPNTTFVNRVVYPSTPFTTPPSLCSPASTQDGCLEQTATRRFGRIDIGGLPASLSTPPGWTGYFLSITGYQDSVSTAAGVNAPSPSAPAPVGTVSYWNGNCNNGSNPPCYTSLSVTDGTLSTIVPSLSWSQPMSGQTVTVNVSLVSNSTSAAVQSVSSTAGTVTVSGVSFPTLTDVVAQGTPPQMAVLYQVWIGSTEVVHLTITLNLGTMEARGTYAAAPAQGS